MVSVELVYAFPAEENRELVANFALTTYTVTFNVMDEDGDLITEAIITFDGVENAPGDYVFDNLISGNYHYKIEKAGYFTVEDEVDVEEDMTVDVTLEEDDTFVIDPIDIKLGIYPNPARERLFVESNLLMEELRILDLNGKVIYTSNVGADNHEIDVSGFNTGTYFIHVVTSEGMANHSVQVVR